MVFRSFLLLGILYLTTYVAPAAAQDYAPEGLQTEVARQQYLSSLEQAHQELRKLEAPILSEYGYDSPEHRELLTEIRQRDSALLVAVHEYLDLYGFPVRDRKREAALRKRRQALLKQQQQSFFEAYQQLPEKDSLKVDSLVKAFQFDVTSVGHTSDYRGTILLILGVDTDFTSRCATIAYLRPEYEAEEISVLSMLTYLRHTYQLRFGQELDIAPGTTEPERLSMYARELSGCW
ncbi:MAG: hypothetical protein AAGF89_08100 [Bacteroidota bacterium]